MSAFDKVTATVIALGTIGCFTDAMIEGVLLHRPPGLVAVTFFAAALIGLAMMVLVWIWRP